MPDYEPSEVDPFIPSSELEENEPHPFIPGLSVDPFEVKMPKGDPEVLDVENNPKHKEEVEIQRQRIEDLFNEAKKYSNGVGYGYFKMPAGAVIEFRLGRVSIEAVTNSLRSPYALNKIELSNQVMSVPFANSSSQVYELAIPKLFDLELSQFVEEYYKDFKVKKPNSQIPVKTRFQLDEEGHIEKRFTIGHSLDESREAPPGGPFYNKPVYLNDMEIIDATLTEIEYSMGLRNKPGAKPKQEGPEK